MKQKPDEIQANVVEALKRLRQAEQAMSHLVANEDSVRSAASRPANDVRGDPFFRSISPGPDPLANTERSAPTGDTLFALVVKLLGGRRVWKTAPTNRLEVHEAIRAGISSEALSFVLQTMSEIPADKILDVIGLSRRTAQRRASAPQTPLSQEQGGRLWKLAEILAKTTELMGDRKSAERWLNAPALALSGRVPIDLMTTQAGAEMVEQLLTRIEYGVYT